MFLIVEQYLPDHAFQKFLKELRKADYFHI